MTRTFRTLAVMLLIPPLILYPLAQAHILLSGSPGWWLATVLISVWVIGMAALLASGWRRSVIALVGSAYTLVSFFALPMMALSASCVVGPCL